MEIKEKDIKVIIQNTIVSKTLTQTNSLEEAVEVVHIPTGTRAESFSLSTVMANKARCIQNLNTLLKAIGLDPVSVNGNGPGEPTTLHCANCDAVILSSYNFCPNCSQAIAKK